MKPKKYQEKVVQNLSSYLDILNFEKDLTEGWMRYWREQDITPGQGDFPRYRNTIPRVPHVCMKVPTGGGKTFLACASVRRIFNAFPLNRPKVVVWLVPSEAILTQTLKALSDPDHPYRQTLNSDFAGSVGVYTKEMLLNAQGFSPDTVQQMLTICVLSYASLRVDSKKKDIRKVYQENGNLLKFQNAPVTPAPPLPDASDLSLMQVIRNYEPVVVVDESHNASSQLSVEMLTNLNPSFILELTATPRSTSNILSYVDARELKNEHMVKLPVVVFNRSNRKDVLLDAIQMRKRLEAEAKAQEAEGGPYIRPIVLFQAQPRVDDESDTFEKLKEHLLKCGIPEEQIAIKTSQVNDLANVDLLSEKCQIRYIITVNALKEGWDCPFAYILASVANKNSRVDVEQIVGRILRQPYTRRHKSQLLNNSYVFTCSKEFHATLDNIILGLNRSGFSKKDYRVAENDFAKPEEPPTQAQPELPFPGEEPKPLGVSEPDVDPSDPFADINPEDLRGVVETPVSVGEGGPENPMVQTAIEQGNQYEEEARRATGEGTTADGLSDFRKSYKVQLEFLEELKALRLPQFCLQSQGVLFKDSQNTPLYPENLSEDFSLTTQDANINFSIATEVAMIDLGKGENATPRYQTNLDAQHEYLIELLKRMPKKSRISRCAKEIARLVDRGNNNLETSEVTAYVKRVIQNMSEDDLNQMETSLETYAEKIRQKIHELEVQHRANTFKQWLDKGKIDCHNVWAMPLEITPQKTIDTVVKSLYEAEWGEMNDFERKVLDTIAGSPSVRWWHRIIEKKDFHITGSFNHYPDFMVMTQSGKLLLVEAKGDHLTNEDSRAKLELGRKWQEAAGKGYRYFMVFNQKDPDLDGAYTLADFANLLAGI